MWAVTNQSLTLYRLPARGILQSRISQFERAAALNRGDPAHLGESFYRMLFSGVPRELVSRQQWLLALDGALFDLPFPALSPSPGRFLIEDHSIQIVPGALILTGGNRPAASGGSFLAVGDPIYNRADPRARERGGWMWPALFARPGSGGGPAFARLWGTAREIQISAIAWKASGPALLTGKDASPENFWKRVGNKPEIIHIATHILEEREQLRAAWIAFSLGSDGRVQYVTPEDISAKSVAAKLVVLSGCGSGKGDVQPATGLMGLTRAWIAAGAGAVLATRWPTVDDDGAFFESFYRNLRQQKPMNPAAALRNASIEMLKSGTWRANPSFWAGYFLIGN
jgi:CHAT domain-containing protein